MAIDWKDVRYRGDTRDVEELLTTYRVADYLETFEENRRQVDHGVRERLMKEGIRLSEKNLNLDIEALLSQIDEIRGRPELIEETFASHPLLPIRLKAAELFSRSAKAQRAGYVMSGDPLTDDDLEQAVDDLVKLTRRYPFQPLYQNVMRAVALGGAVLLGADKDVSDEEVKILVQILHQWFTDEPETEILTDRDAIQARLPDVLAKVREEGSPDDRTFILSRLTDVAMADGALMDAESAVILDVARQLDVPAKTAYAVMVGAAQSTGFRTDVKLNRMAEEIRRSMMLGLKG